MGREPREAGRAKSDPPQGSREGRWKALGLQSEKDLAKPLRLL